MRLWDIESLRTLAARQAQVARDVGAFVHLRYAISFLVLAHGLDGELSAAALVMEEDRLIAETTGTPPNTYAAMMLAGWRGHESQASALIEASVQAGTAHGIAALINGAVICSTGSGCAASGAAVRLESSCAWRTRCWTRWAWRRSPSGPA